MILTDDKRQLKSIRDHSLLSGKNQNTMKKNMGFSDRAIRVVMFIILVILFFAKIITGTWAIIALAIAIVMLITSLIGFCPLYAPFRISTLRKKIISGKSKN